MPDPVKWEYHAERLPDQADLLDDSMKLWSDSGWELLTATSTCAPVRQGNAQVWQVTYVLFWRRPLDGV
jgi:hypothetical protein